MTPIERARTPLSKRTWPTASRVACFSLAVGLTACSLFGPPINEMPLSPGARAERIDALRELIARDHASLESLITQPQENGKPDLHQDPAVRTIATRLAEHERELARLETLAREEVQ